MAGLLAGAAYWVRPEALLVLPVALLTWLSVSRIRQAKWPLLGSVASMTAASLALVLPYALMIGGLSKKKDWLHLLSYRQPTGDGVNTCALLTLDLHAYWEMLKCLTEAATPLLAGAGALFLLLRRRRVVRMFRTSANWRLIILLLLAYAWLGTKVFARAGYLDWRHMMMAAMIIAPFGTNLVLSSARLLRRMVARQGKAKKGKILAFMLVALFGTMVGLRTLSHTVHSGRAYHRLAGLAAARLAHPDEPLVTDSLWVKYYSRLPGLVLAEGTPPTESWRAAANTLRTQLPTSSSVLVALVLPKPNPAFVVDPHLNYLDEFTNESDDKTIRLYRWQPQ
jgi:hypothetical protein